MKYKIRIGDIYDLNSVPPADISAVCSCIHYTENESVRYGKPFVGLNISADEPIMPSQFEKAITFIGKYIKEGDVQVACREGRCRSVSVALAYYLSTGIDMEEAVRDVGRSPSCWVHGKSLLDWAHKRGLIDKETYEKAESEFW